MGGFEKQVKERAKEMKHYLNKGAKVVGESCKKGWLKLKNIRSGQPVCFVFCLALLGSFFLLTCSEAGYVLPSDMI